MGAGLLALAFAALLGLYLLVIVLLPMLPAE